MDKLKNKIQQHIDQLNVDEPNIATWGNIQSNLSASAENDSLKNFIAENKNSLNIDAPKEQVWKRIKGVIAGKQQSLLIKRRMFYLAAACITVIASVGLLRYMNADKADRKNEVVQTNVLKESSPGDSTNFEISRNVLELKKKSLPAKPKTAKGNDLATRASTLAKKQKKKLLPPEVLQIQTDYDELISSQIKYTTSLAIYGESAGYFEQFKNDFKTLEKKEKDLRMSIIKSGLQENSITELAMIYQEKLTVLKKLQNEITKTSTRNKNVTDTIPAYINL